MVVGVFVSLPVCLSCVYCCVSRFICWFVAVSAAIITGSAACFDAYLFPNLFVLGMCLCICVWLFAYVFTCV